MREAQTCQRLCKLPTTYKFLEAKLKMQIKFITQETI
jgi:hypothetical protein